MKYFYLYRDYNKILIYPPVNGKTSINIPILQKCMENKAHKFIKTGRDPKETYYDIVPIVCTRDGYIIDGEYHERLPMPTRQWLIRAAYDGIDLDKFYKEWLDVAPLLFNSGIPVHLYRYDRDVIYNAFHSMLRKETMERLPMPDSEQQYWIAMSLHSGYRYADNGWTGYAHQYDFTSFYAYIMLNYEFPCGKPRFARLSEYDPNLLAIFRWNNDTYNGYRKDDSLMLADDGGWNALIYDEKIHGRELFGKYIDTIYPLKMKGYEIAKVYLNNLTGMLARYNWIDKNNEIIDTYRTEGNDNESVIPSSMIFKYPKFSNIYGFICLYGQKMMHEMHTETFKYIHTDGFITTEPIDLDVANEGFKPGDIGYLKYEGYAKYKVESSRKHIILFSSPDLFGIKGCKNAINVYSALRGDKLVYEINNYNERIPLIDPNYNERLPVALVIATEQMTHIVICGSRIYQIEGHISDWRAEVSDSNMTHVYGTIDGKEYCIDYLARILISTRSNTIPSPSSL